MKELPLVFTETEPPHNSKAGVHRNRHRNSQEK